MEKIVHTGGGTFVDTQQVAAPDGVEDDPNVHVYAYARFRSLEHVSFGLFRTTGGPEDEEVDSESVGQYGMEPIARYWEYGLALEEIEKAAKRKKETLRFFEEEPYVEVTDEEDYDAALEALGLDAEDGAWEKPGLYDFRDDPPTYVSSVEDYELESMTEAADRAFEFMFQGEEWEDAYKALAEEEEEEEDEGEETD